MRRRANSIGQQIAYHLEDNRSIYLFIIVLFLMGIIFGAIIVNSLSLNQRYDLYSYLSQFFGQVAQGEVADSRAMFSQSFAHYLKYIGLMWILGLTIIGLPIILILLFIKGVVIGFTVGFLVNQLGMAGFLLAFAAIMPQNFILVPAFIIIGTAAVAFSLKLIRQQFIKKMTEPIFHQFIRYSILVLCIGAVLAIASGFEAYVSPTLMRIVLNWG